jgi:PAS domain S-box-containing protein
MASLATVRGRWTGFQPVDRAGAANPQATELANVLDTVEVPIIVAQRDLRVAGFNHAAVKVLSLSPSDVGRQLRDVSGLAGVPRLEEQCTAVIDSGVESRTDLRDGQTWFVVRVSPYTKGDRRVAGAVLTFTNVTAFRASIDHAVYEREVTKAILNTVADPLIVVSADQRIQSGNRAFYNLFGVSRDETQGAPLYELGGGAFQQAALRKQIRKLLAGGQVFEPVEVDEVATARGLRTLSLDARPLSFPGHPERGILVTFQDITVRKQAEAAKDLRSEAELRRSEAILAEGQRLSLTGSFSWKVATDEITWSEQLYRIYELEVGEPLTFDLIRSRVHPGDISLIEKMRMIDQVPDGSKDFEWQYRLLMPDRSVKYLHALAHAIRDHNGQLEYIAVVQDVTARRLSEEALAKARSELATVARAMSLGVLTASIAHEVNQPLSGIITNAGTCLRMLDANPPNVAGARETAQRIIRDANRASDVITRLRALFRKDELTLESFDLNEVMREVLALSSSDLQRTHITLRCELAEDLQPVTGDRIQLQQVILNLLRNASDAMVDIRDRPREVVITTEREDGDRVRVRVRDAGVGVDPQIVNKLLDAFYTTKRDGMGIGLSVSRSIIERHGGHLWAEPNDGPGATFSFSIPRVPESVPGAARK